VLGGKNILAPPPTKTAKFEVKNIRKSAKEAIVEYLLLLFLFFFDSNKMRFRTRKVLVSCNWRWV